MWLVIQIPVKFATDLCVMCAHKHNTVHRSMNMTTMPEKSK